MTQDQADAIERQLARIEAKLDKAIDDHETRIRRAERALYIATGLAMAGAGTGLSALAGVFGGGGP